MSRGWRIAGWSVGGLLLVLLLGWVWLFHTDSGRDFALQRLRSTLGPQQWSTGAAEGTLAGPLTLHDIDYRFDDGRRLRIERLTVAWQRRGLLGRRLVIERLDAAGIELQLPVADAERPEPFQWPQRLPWPELQLPLSIELQQATLRELRIVRDGETILALAEVDAAAQWSRGGPLQIDRLRIDGEPGELLADGTLRLDGRIGAELRARFLPRGAAQPLTLTTTTTDGRLRALLDVPGSGELRLELSDALDWRLDIALQQFDPDRWWPPDAAAEPNLPLDLHLQAHGDHRTAVLQGTIARDGRQLLIEPSTLRFADDGELRFDPLRLALADGGTLDLRGRILLADTPRFELDAALDALPLPLGEGEPARLGGRLRLDGPIDRLLLQFDGQLARLDLQADLQLQAQLLDDRLQIEQIELVQAHGRLVGRGTVHWQPEPAWNIDAELQDFDPGVIADALSGRLAGRIVSEGRIGDEGVALELLVESMRGRLRDRPLQAEGRLSLQPDGRGSADLQARFGDSRLRVQGEPGAARDLEITLEPLDLADLLPSAQGRLRGSLRLRGSGADARIAGRLRGSDIDWKGDHAGQLELELDAPLSLRDGGRLQLSARDLQLRDEPLDRLELDIEGGFDGLVAAIELAGPRVALSGRWHGRRDGDDWVGELRDLELTAPDVPRLTLQQPAQIRIGPGGLELGRNCLSTPQGSACFAIRQQDGRQQVELELEQLPLSLLDPWLPAGDTRLRLEGRISGQLDAVLVDGVPERAIIDLRSPAGAVHWLAEPEQRLIEWQDLRIDGRLQEGRLQLDVAAAIDGEGRLQASVAGGSPLDPQQSLAGRIDLALPEVRLLSLLPDTVVSPRGRLQAELRLGGTYAEPDVSGDIELREFAAEIPALGIALADASLALRGDLRSLRIDGRASSDGQPLQFAGTLQMEDKPRLDIAISGQDVLLVDTPLVRAVASPDLQAQYDGELLRLRGSLGVPTARLALERLERTEPVSDDVVVLDPDPEREQDRPLPIDADVRVVLGDAVDVAGFGFDGGLSGTLRVRERPGRPTTARGTLAVRGDYTAYGQDLVIERGQLVYAGTPIDDPALDLRVKRDVRGQRVGLDIRGRARDPSLSVWSEGDTMLDQGEALSLLMFGRPLSSAGDTDSEQLTDAALAVGGNLLAARLGARLGFDTFELASSDALGGTAFTVGKYLSPRLQISYGISLFGRGQVLSLSYLIRERFEFQLETGDESRAALNYRIER